MAQQVSLPDGTVIPDFPDNPTAQEIAKLKRVGAEMEAAMSRNPYEGGGPMPKLPASDPRIETLPELGRVAAKTAYDATLGVPVGIDRAMTAGMEGTVGLFSPETANKMRESREGASALNPVAAAAKKAEQFIQPRSSEGTRAANISAMAAGGGLMGKVGTAFSPAMGAVSGGLGGLAGETYGVASNPKKWQGDPAEDEQFGKMAFGMGVGTAVPYGTRLLQTGLMPSLTQKAIAQKAVKDGLTPEKIGATMGAGKILSKGEEVGIPLTSAQAIPETNFLDAAQGLARNRLNMALTRKKLAEQPQQSLDAVKDWTERSVIGGGEVRPTQDLANQARASANSHFDSISADAGAAKDLAMLQSGSTGAKVDPTVVEDFLTQARAYAASRPNTRAQDVVGSVEQSLTNPEWAKHEKLMRGVQPELPNPDVAAYGNDPKMLAIAAKNGIPTTLPNPAYKPNPHPQFLADENQLRGALDSALAGFGKNLTDTPQVSAELNAHAGRLRGLIDDVIAPETPAVNAGKSAAELVLRRADADKQQLIGGMRGEADSPAPLASSPSQIFKDVSRAPVSGQKGEITQLRNDLENGTAFGLQEAAATGRPNPDLSETLFPDAARTHFNDVISQADTRGGARTSDDIARALTERFGNFSRSRDKRADMTQEIIQNSAESQGPRAAAQAPIDKQEFQNIMDVVGHTVERNGAGGLSTTNLTQDLSPQELRTISGFSAVSPLRYPFRAAARAHDSASTKWLDSVLNTDEGRKQFMELMKQPKENMTRAVTSNILREMSTEPRKMQEARAAQEQK